MPDYDDAGWEEWYEEYQATPVEERPETVHDVAADIVESVSEVLSSPARALEEWGKPTPERLAAAWGTPDITTLEGITHEDPSGFRAWGQDWSVFYENIGTTELKLKPLGEILDIALPDIKFPDINLGGMFPSLFPQGWSLFPEVKTDDWLFWGLVGVFGIVIAVVIYKWITKKEIKIQYVEDRTSKRSDK